MSKLTIKKSSGDVVARLYTTDIVKISNNKFTLNSGGYKTSLIKKSMNRVLSSMNIPITVFSHENVWKIVDKNGKMFPFEDGKEYKY
jgi:hypothetical protein